MAFKMRATRNTSIKITRGESAGVEYAAQCKNLTWTKSGGTKQEWQGGDPATSFTDVTPEGYDAALTFGQDWEDPDSLARILFAHSGEEAEIAYQPTPGGVIISATVTLAAPATIGGELNTFQDSTVSMPSSKPVFTPPAP